MKTNLFKVFYQKEKLFWNRTREMKDEKEISFIGFLIATVIISIGHYAFAFMHFLFECFLFVFFRKQFKSNLEKLVSVN